jgi:hypothetical protein
MVLPLWGQSVVVNNPSTCRIGLDLTDASCDPTVNVVPDPDVVVINVNNAPGTVLGQNVVLSEVQLIIRHTWANDLDISLRSPAGITIPLSFDNGGGDDNFGDPILPNCSGVARLSMGSCVSVEEGVPPFTSQVWRPEGSFYDFNDGVTDPNGLWELIICDDAEGDIGRLDYVNLIFAPLNCVPVEEVSILSVDTTSVTIDWQPATSCGTTVVEYGPVGFTPGSDGTAGGGTVETLTGCPPFTLSNLPAEADFDLYVRKSCSGNYSVNSCPVTFTTGCAPPPVSLLEHFDNEADCDNFCDSECSLNGIWQNAAYNTYNWLVNTGPTATAGTGPSTDFSGSGNYLYLEASGQFCDNNKTAYLISDCIRLDKSGTDTCHFSFAYHMFGDGIGQLRVQASDDGGFTWTTLWQRSGSQGDQWRQAYIGLGDYADGSVLRLRMLGEEGNGTRGDIAIDELAFHGSTTEGPPAFVYYTDADSDGYGDSNQPISSCASSAPSGYASLDGDCDDTDPNINPGAVEIPCNSIDENCNGDTDDSELPPPAAINDTICVGGTAVLRAEDNFGKIILWYDQPTGGNPINFGETYIPTSALDNNGPAPAIYTFYAEESDFTCVSATRAAASVIVNPTPNASVSNAPSICPGDSIDLSSISIQDANFTGGGLSFHSNLPTNAGNELPSTIVQPSVGQVYYYRMTAPFGCFDEGAFTIGVKSGPSLSLQPADTVSICKDESGSLGVVPSGGESPYSYLWSTGDMESSINISSSTQAGVTDTYRLTVTDAAGCFSVDSIRVATTVSVDSVRRFVSNVSTCQGTDGRITLVPLDGTSPYNYVWEGTNGVTGSSSGLSDTLVISNLPQGAYRVTITDSSPEGCTRVVRSILVNGPGAAVQQIERNAVTCPGAMDGNICLSVFGTAPAYAWNTGDTTACIDNLSGGYYAVTVTDGECETVLDSLLIEEAEGLQVAYTSQMPSCVDASDGAIQAQVFGGEAPYDYQWSQGSNFPDPFGLTAGDYILTVTDGRNCVLVDTFELLAPPVLSVDLLIGEDVSCPGATDGQLLASGLGGTPPYRYEWSHGSSGPYIVNLPPADYIVTVTDFNGCSAVETYTVGAPDPLQLNVEEIVNPACIGEKTGLIRLSGEGGTRPYTYQWNVVGTDSLQNDLSVGTYTAVLVDANGCTSDSVTVTMDAMSVLDLVIDVVAPPCVGPATGSISLQPQGTPPFSYDWANGASGSDLENLEVGEYPLVITDGQGCIYDTTVVVSAPQLFSVNVNTLSPACAGSEDGLINLTTVNTPGAPPFTPPLSYTWSDGANGASRVGIGGGDYLVTITDINGCAFESDTIPLLEPLPVQLGLEGLGPIVCRGDSTGFIELDVRGGTPPYVYNWVGQTAVTQDLFDIPAGTYRLLVSDSKDCSYDTTFVLNDPPALSVGIGIDAEDICSGGRVEKLIAQAQGGIPPYQLAWSNGSTDSLIVNPATADYTLSVTDANNCLQTAGPLKVKEETAPLVFDSVYAQPTGCFGQNDACMTAEISGGSGNYQYHFSNGQITYTDTTALTTCNLATGNYRVTVTDFTTGCFIVSNNVSVTEPLPLTFQRDSVQPVRCFGGLTGAVFASTSGGTPPYTYIWRNSSNGNVVGNNEDLQGVPAGTYNCLVFDERGCSASLVGTVPSLNTLMRDTLVDIAHIACRGDTLGAIDLDIAGGMPPYSFAWNDGLGNTVPLANLPAGTYTLTVTDAFDCTQIFPSYVVEEPDSLLELASVSIDSLLCYGDADGTIKVELAGGVPPYELEWERNGIFLPTSADSLVNVFAGNYTLRVLDDNGCLKSYNIEMPQPDSVMVEVDTLLGGGLPPRAFAIVSGGTPPYELLWDTGETADTIFVDNGVYQLLATDANGCTGFAKAVIVSTRETSPLLAEANVYPNPAHEQLWVEARLHQAQPLRLRLLTMQGQVVWEKPLGLRTEVRERIELSMLPQGGYWLQLIGVDGRLGVFLVQKM